MSTTRTYALWSCPDAGVATQPQPQNVSILRQDEPSLARDPPPHMLGSLPFASTTVALYSHVVASRSPSPLGRLASGMAMMPPREPRSVGPLGGNAPVGNEAKPTASTESHEPYTSIEEDQSPEDPGEPWTTVRCRWARSLELANLNL